MNKPTLLSQATAQYAKSHALNQLAAPRLEKAVINVGIGRLKAQGGDEGPIMASLALITGQKPEIRLSRKAIAGFKLRAQQPTGVRVTIRGRRLDDFVTRLIHAVLPRVRDFRGISSSTVTGKSISFGLIDSLVFPELPAESSSFGMTVTLVTTAKSKVATEEFLKLLGFPFKKTSETGRIANHGN